MQQPNVRQGVGYYVSRFQLEYIALHRYKLSRIFFLSSKLQFVELRVKTTHREQFSVRSALDDPARIDHEDHIRAPHGRQPMRDYNRSSSRHQIPQGVEDEFLGGRIQA